MGLFIDTPFVSHAGRRLEWKIDCDDLDDDSVRTIASIIAGSHRFSQVEGIPRGGIRLANALRKYCIPHEGLLIVDDVFTTGGSMQLAFDRAKTNWRPEEIKGAVIFARGSTPAWIDPLFYLAQWARERTI